MSRKTRHSVLRNKLDDMIAGIRNDIESGKLGSGDFLPSELELAEKYDISKHSVRKGLDVLVGQGYVLKIPRVGSKATLPGPKPTTTLRFGYYPSMHKQAGLTGLIKLFHERHPDIQVELIPVPFKFDELHLMKHYLDAGLIDVAMFNHQSFAELEESTGVAGILEPLEPESGIYPFLFKAFQSNNQLFAMPFVFSPVILAYNKDHFSEYDLPEPDSSWSWDELLRVAGEIGRSNNRVGFYYHALSDNRWPVFLLQSGEKLRDGATKGLVFNRPAVREAIRMSRDILVTQGLTSLLSQNNAEAEELFRSGKISIIMTSYFGLNQFHDAPFRFDIAPLPALQSADTLNLVIGLAISSKSIHKEAAKALITELSSLDFQRLVRSSTLSIPAYKRAAESGREPEQASPVTEPPRFPLYREIIRSFRLHSEIGLSGEVLKRMRGELKLYWAGITDLDTCCKNLEEALVTKPVG